MVPDIPETTLLVVDVQQRLIGAMDDEIAARLVRNVDILAELVADFGGRVVYSEQYPRGLGPTVESLRPTLEGATRVEKVEFSCLQNETFREQVLGDLGRDVIVVGIEAHVCVLQTVFDLVGESLASDDEESDRMVYVPIDAIASRSKLNWQNALDQMADLGVVLTNTETVVFQALGDAGHERFKHYSKRIR